MTGEIKVPKEVSHVTKVLKEAGFEAFLVGGCVRDLILERKPKDWDVTTNAKPEQIQALFEDTFYENSFGTVGILNREATDETLKIVEVTPYRLESLYSDHRRPDSVLFSETLEEDLKRRDFTINALAFDVDKGQIIDLYKGQDDLKKGIIRTVGEPNERFNEDALRMLRAIRLGAELGFMCNTETAFAIQNNRKLLNRISKERIRDEFVRMIMSDSPMLALGMCEKLGILEYISPDFLRSVGVTQNKQAHIYTVWEHLLRSLQHAADKKWSLEVRLAALFHDISKPETRREIKDKSGKVVNCTFFGHEVVGARVTRETLKELKFPLKTVEKVEKLVRWHMFFADTEQITLSAVRRMIANVGKENIDDLMKLRSCDRIGTGRPKENPYRLRKYKSMIDEALRDPISVGMLKIDGKDVLRETNEAPSPKVGHILHALLGEVFENPTLNNKMFLVKRAKELNMLPVEELVALGEKGRVRKEEEDEKELEIIKKRHSVQ